MFVFVSLCVHCLNVCERGARDLSLFVVHCVMLYDVSVMCDCACVSP